MKKYLLFLLAAILPALRIGAQQPPGVACQEWQVVAGDTIPHVRIRPVWVFARGADLRRYRKLVAAVKKVYPVAKIARARMTEMEAELQRLPTKKAQKAYIRGVYRQIKEEYTPVVRHMTRTQGKVLLKLIDRETDYTAYEVLREFRGGFVAGFWQTLSRVFGLDLKSEYDAEGDDRLLEQIVRYYEAGLLLPAVRSVPRASGRTVFRKIQTFQRPIGIFSIFLRKFVNEPAGIRLPFDEQPSTAPPCRPCRTTGLCARPLLYIIHSLNYIL